MTRVYLHSKPNLSNDLATLTFVDDVKGGTLVQCSSGWISGNSCGEEFILTDEMEECPKCKGDLIFPRAEW